MKYRWLTLLALCLLYPDLSCEALNPEKAMTQYFLETWTTNNGLPENSVFTIRQTRDGYLWLGTEEGLVRFDGVKFTVFDKSNTPEFRDNAIMALVEDRQGSLWIGSYGGGLTQLKDGKFKNYSTRDGLSNDYVYSLAADPDDSIWIGTSAGGLNRLSKGKIKNYTVKDGLIDNVIWSLYVDRRGILWIGTRKGLNSLKDGKFTAYTTRDGLSNDTIRTITEDAEGTLWLGTGAGLTSLKDGRFKIFTDKEGLTNNVVWSLFPDSSGTIWIGTYGGGLVRYRNGSFSSYTTKDGLSNDLIWSLYGDPEGSLWIGTYGGGLDRMKDGKFTGYSTREGLSYDSVSCFLKKTDGIWIGTRGGGVNQWKDGKWSTLTTKDGLSSDVVHSIYEDRTGRFWIATRQGLNMYRAGKIKIYTQRDGLVNDIVHSILEDHEGNIWAGSREGGLMRMKGDRFVRFTDADGLSNDFVYSLYEDSRQNLWIGTRFGLIRYRDNKFTILDAKDGLSSPFIYALYEDSEGVLWIATRGGLNRLKDGRITSYTTRQGLFHDSIFFILEDDRNHLWMSSNRGIFRVSKNGLNDLADEKIKTVSSISYGKADGMKSEECNGGQFAGLKTADGKLWFATVKGAAMVDPKQIKMNTNPPRVLMEKVIVDGEAIFSSGTVVRLKPGKRRFEFHYTGLDFLAPDQLAFKFKLEGFDESWVEAGTRRIAYYTNVPPGDYRFHVIAGNSDGVWSQNGASFAFALLPFFHQTIWFYTFLAVGFILIGFSAHFLRMGQIRARFSAVLAERARIAREIHDTLAQGLMGIVLQLEAAGEAAPDQSERHRAKALDLARMGLEEARRSVGALRPQALENADFLGALKSLTGQLARDTGLPVEIHVTGKARQLPPFVEENLLRIAQEAVLNAAKHAKAHSVCINLSFDVRSIRLSVADDGTGFVPKSGSSEPGHFGLIGMRERVEQMKGSLQIQSEPGKGTQISVDISV